MSNSEEPSLPKVHGGTDDGAAGALLPPPNTSEIEEFNILLNSQATYNMSATLLKNTVKSLLEAGNVERALGFIDGENILISYMKDHVIIDLLKEFITTRQLDLFPRFESRLNVPSLSNSLVSDQFDEAIKLQDFVCCHICRCARHW